MIYILLPAFNESSGIETILHDISHQLEGLQYLLVVVNDGSTDDTFNILKKFQANLNLKIINHEKNLGLGSAMKTGISYISSVINNDDILITMDADNTHPVDLIPKLTKEIQNGFDVVIASRYAIGGNEIGLTKFRKILSGGASTLLKLFFPIQNVTDYTSGYRAYLGKIIKKSNEFYADTLVSESGFTCMAEILIKLSHIGATITEKGLILRYDLKQGKSKIKILRTILGYFRLILKLKFLNK
ncbi:MAG TPA: glycosyltransferase [Elusimicrobia bacterium]|nr:glycosyltransferase [Elusimicrobiota bacterium]